MKIFIGLIEVAGKVGKIHFYINKNVKEVEVYSVLLYIPSYLENEKNYYISEAIFKYGEYKKFMRLLLPFKSLRFFLKSLDYDYIIFTFGTTFFWGLDLLILKRIFKKKLIAIYCGDDVRLYSISKKLNPFTKFYIQKKSQYSPIRITLRELRNRIRLWWQSKFIDKCFIKEDLYDYVNMFFPDNKISNVVINHPMYLNEIAPKFPRSNGKLVVSHIPSYPVVKGTKYVINAVENLKRKGLDFEFIIPEKFVNHIEVMKIIENSDIVVDQLLAGSFGTLSVEAMAYGKVVVSYISENVLKNLKRFYRTPLPIVNANPENLEKVLEDLIISPRDKLISIGLKSREFVEKEFEISKVVKKLIEEIKNI